MILVAKTETTVADVLKDRIMAAFANGCADLQAVGYLSSKEILTMGLGLLDGMREGFASLDASVAAEDLVTLAQLAKRVAKKAIAYKKTPLSDADEGWDGPGEVAEAEVEDLKVMCTIVQGEGENKGDYKLPHHKAAGKHACVLAGVRAAGGVLQGAHGGLDASEDEIAGAKKHLARHYAEFSEEAPWEQTEARQKEYDAIVSELQRRGVSSGQDNDGGYGSADRE